MYNPADKWTNRQTSPSTSYRESVQSCRLGMNVLFNWFTACTTFPNHTQTCKSRCELYVYIEPGGVRVGLEVVSRYFSLSAAGLTATTHSSLLFNYLLLIRDEGVQAWVKRYKHLAIEQKISCYGSLLLISFLFSPSFFFLLQALAKLQQIPFILWCSGGKYAATKWENLSKNGPDEQAQDCCICFDLKF